MITAIPPNVWDSNGLSTPDEPEILGGVIVDLQEAFDNNLNLDSNDYGSMATPQGQLATSLTQIKGEINDNLRFLASQINPKYASGIYQDALAWLYFITRKPSTPTNVSVECYGLDGTVIPVGARVQDLNSNVYRATGTATISAGVALVNFENEVNGATPATSNTVTKIYQTVVGWESCNNPFTGIMGTNEESQQELEARRYDSVAKNAIGTLNSIFAAVSEIEGVTDVHVRENFTGAPIVITGYTLVKHSIYVAVVGGNDEEIAKAIHLKKDVGADYNGNTIVNVKDTNYEYPQPIYAVKFERPAALAILFNVDIVADPLLPADSDTLIKNAIIESFNGLDNRPRTRIGVAIIANRFTQNIYNKIDNINVLDIDIGTVAADSNRVDVPIDKTPTLQESDIVINYL